MRIIFPNSKVPWNPSYGPLFYLAGPVLGGGDWQKECCEVIRNICPSFYAAIPYWRLGEDHPLRQYEQKGDAEYTRQLEWEWHYMEQAARSGCLLFWLPCESLEYPRIDGYPYAKDTNNELIVWGNLVRRPGYRVVAGAEDKFPGLSRIRSRFDESLNGSFVIHPSLEDTVRAAYKRACQGKP